MKFKQRPGVVFQPVTSKGIQRGIQQLVNVIRPTLGPFPRNVAYELDRRKGPELLDDGGTIARRIIEIPGRDPDMGAMLLRQMLWQLHQKVGDGTATAAVMFDTVFSQGLRYIAAGSNAMLLRRHLEQGLELIYHELTAMTIAIRGKERLAQTARSICYDEVMAKYMGEIFDIIGEYGRLEIRTGNRREIDREYVEGMYWKGGYASREMINNYERFRAELENAAILITDLEIEDPRDVIPPVALAIKGGHKNLMLIVKKISDKAMAVLLDKRTKERINVLAVKLEAFLPIDYATAQQDLAVLTGGRPIVKAAGQTLTGVTAPDLGQARKVWADRYNFGLSGGKGDSRQLRQHIAQLRSGYNRIEDPEARIKQQERLGKLLGGSATLWVGGITKSEVETRKTLATRASQALRGAIAEGVVPGGGMAFMACRPALRARLAQSTTPEEKAAYKTLLEAMETPLRTIVTNAGHNAEEIVARINLAGPGYGFDVATEEIVAINQSGLYDVATVTKEAVHSAISGAALALTIDVLVHHKEPETSNTP